MRVSKISPRTCSGDIYAAVPIATPVPVTLVQRVECVSAEHETSSSPASVLAKAKIQNLNLSYFCDKNVRRLDVAMDYTFLMSRLEAADYLNSNIQ